MHPELALKAVSHTIIALSLAAILVVLLISLKKEMIQGMILSGVVHLCLAVLGIFAFIALATIYFHARKIVLPYAVSQKLDTASVRDYRSFDVALLKEGLHEHFSNELQDIATGRGKSDRGQLAALQAIDHLQISERTRM